MSTVETTTAPWGPEEGRVLRQARERVGDTQGDCAERIARHAGGDPVGQGTIYSWEKGRHAPSADHRVAIAAYIKEALEEDLPKAQVHSPTGARSPRPPVPAAADPGLTNPLTGERELSDRQAALVDMINREAPNIDDAGMEAIRFNARVLGLGEYLD